MISDSFFINVFIKFLLSNIFLSVILFIGCVSSQEYKLHEDRDIFYLYPLYPVLRVELHMNEALIKTQKHYLLLHKCLLRNNLEEIPSTTATGVKDEKEINETREAREASRLRRHLSIEKIN